ncbi:hypothetical protein ACI00D_004600 [Cronobacter dublinensis]
MITISNERLESLQRQFMEEGFNDIRDSEVMQLVEENLALRKERERAEPVGEVVDQPDGLVMDGTVHLGGSGTHRAIKGLNKMKRMPLGTKFYTAPPAPAVPDLERLKEIYSIFCTPTTGSDNALSAIHNACRAAMLNQAQPIAETDATAQQFESLEGKAVVPDGWRLVPIDPTKDMLRAGQSVVGFWLNTIKCYEAMLAAAPEQCK